MGSNNFKHSGDHSRNRCAADLCGQSRYLQFLALGGAGTGFIAVFLAAESYRLERLAIWRDPEKYEKGFQTIQGLYAIGSGGIFGKGFGNSLQKLGFVPEARMI